MSAPPPDNATHLLHVTMSNETSDDIKYLRKKTSIDQIYPIEKTNSAILIFFDIREAELARTLLGAANSRYVDWEFLADSLGSSDDLKVDATLLLAGFPFRIADEEIKVLFQLCAHCFLFYLVENLEPVW